MDSLDTLWFGMKLGGVIIGMTLIRFLWREITSFVFARQFRKRGCKHSPEGGGE